MATNKLLLATVLIPAFSQLASMLQNASAYI